MSPFAPFFLKLVTYILTIPGYSTALRGISLPISSFGEIIVYSCFQFPTFYTTIQLSDVLLFYSVAISFSDSLFNSCLAQVVLNSR